MSNAQTYASYMREEAEVGQWTGKGAEMLGLTGEVGLREFATLRYGEHPKTGEALRRQVEDTIRHKPWGDVTYRARELYEITVSAPKSVSIQGIVDPEVVAAHMHAVEKIMHDLEYATQRDLVMATWQHRSSRAGDPQLHTHIAVMNVAHGEDGWGGLRARELFINQRQLTATYRAAVLGEVEAKGYKIAYPEIAGISEELRDKYSQRRHQVEEKIEEYRNEHGMQPSYRAVQAMVLNTREPKDARTAREIAAEQYDRLAPGERAQLVALATEAGERRSPYVSPHLQEKYGEKSAVVAAEKAGKKPQLVIQDGGSGEGSAEDVEWSYGRRKRGLGMGM